MLACHQTAILGGRSALFHAVAGHAAHRRLLRRRGEAVPLRIVILAISAHVAPRALRVPHHAAPQPVSPLAGAALGRALGLHALILQKHVEPLVPLDIPRRAAHLPSPALALHRHLQQRAATNDYAHGARLARAELAHQQFPLLTALHAQALPVCLNFLPGKGLGGHLLRRAGGVGVVALQPGAVLLLMAGRALLRERLLRLVAGAWQGCLLLFAGPQPPRQHHADQPHTRAHGRYSTTLPAPFKHKLSPHAAAAPRPPAPESAESP